MRMIGSLPSKVLAAKISDYLTSRHIENQITAEEGGAFSLWIYSEDELEEAQKILSEFLSNPTATKYEEARPLAQVIKTQKYRQEKEARKKFIELRTQWHRYNTRLSPVTLTLIILSVVVTLVGWVDPSEGFLHYLYITDYQIVGNYLQWRSGLPEVLHGQVWRLVTPIFIHAGVLHLLFNMLWLKDLGTMIEARQGSIFLVLQVIVIGVISNMAQYLWSGPNFVGMSGVVYGLLGYIWIRGRFDPACGLSLNQGVVTMMIFWFFLCLTGLVGNVANATHAAGLASGMAWGFLAAHFRRGLRR